MIRVYVYVCMTVFVLCKYFRMYLYVFLDVCLYICMKHGTMQYHIDMMYVCILNVCMYFCMCVYILHECMCARKHVFVYLYMYFLCACYLFNYCKNDVYLKRALKQFTVL